MTYDLNVRADLAPSTQAGSWANKNLHKKPGFFMGWRFITDVEGTRQALVDSLNIPFSPCPQDARLFQIGACWIRNCNKYCPPSAM